MAQTLSRRDKIIFVIFIMVAVALVKRLPRDLWWVIPMPAVAGGELLSLILRRPFKPRETAVTAVVAVLISLSVRFLL